LIRLTGGKKVKSLRAIILLLLLLSLPALACNAVTGSLATATPLPTNTPAATATTSATATTVATATAEPTPLPTATPDVTTSFIPFTSEREGITLSYPAAWYTEDSLFLVIAPREANFDGPTAFGKNSGLLILAGPADEFPSQDPRVVVADFFEDFDFGEGREIVEQPTSIRINGAPAAFAVISSTTEAKEDFLVVITVIIDGDRGAAALAGMPQAEVDAYRQTFAAIVDTIVLIEPTGPAVQSEGFLSSGENVTGRVTADESSSWTFIGQEGDAINIVVEPSADLDVVVDVLDSSGVSILPSGEVDASFGTERIEGLRLPASGEFTILVRGYGGSSGDYTLTLTASGLIGIAIPGSSVIAEGTLSSEGRHIFPFFGDAGSIIDVLVEPDSFDVVVEVYRDITGEDDILLETVDASFGNEELTFELPERGGYYVALTGFAGAAGSYTITLSSDPLVIFEVASGDLIYGRVDEIGFIDYRISGKSAVTLNFTVEAEEGFDAVVEILDAEDNVLASVDDAFSGEAETVSFTFPDDARYWIRVRGFANQTGSYVITIE
jgi:hypothetical protein